MPDAHQRQRILKTWIVNLDAHLGLHQFGALVLTSLDRRDAVHLKREVAAYLDKRHTRAEDRGS